MGTRQYIGARYVPKFFENSATNNSLWAANTQYEPLTIVTWNRNVYTSKKPVPSNIGAPNLNPEYWALTGNDGAVGDLIERVNSIEQEIVDIDEYHKYFILSTNDTTDRTQEVLEKLNAYGICYFGPGDFYFNSEIAMPDNSSIIGLGSKSKLHLAFNGNLISVGTNCYVSSVVLIGQETDIQYLPFDKGSRNGIYARGDAQSASEITYSKNYSIVSDVRFINFNGSAIRCYRTGVSGSAINVSNCVIRQCHTGIDIDILSEFNNFTSVSVYYCNIAVTLNGGNNSFSGCTFKSNLNCIVMDNTDNELLNAGHSTFTGCVMAHTGGENGRLISMINIANGMVFSGCSMWHGDIYISNCIGVSITGCIIGIPNKTVSLIGSTALIICNNRFLTNTPAFNFTNSTLVFDNNISPTGVVIQYSSNSAVSVTNTPQAKYFRQGAITTRVECVALCTNAGRYTVPCNLPFVIDGEYTVTLSGISIIGVGSVDVSTIINEYKAAGFFSFDIPSESVTVGTVRLVRFTYTITK